MRIYKVYLAGPIAGLTFNQAQSWRDHFESLMPAEIVCYSPLRGKEGAVAGVAGTAPNGHPLATDRAIMARDHHDCRTADLIVAHLAGAGRVSIGTCMELAWAHALHKPVVATLRDRDLHDHPMVREAITHRADNVSEAAALVRAILLP